MDILLFPPPAGRDGDDLLRVDEVAQQAKISSATVRRWAKVGINGRKLAARKLGNRLYTSWNSVLAFMEHF